MADANKHVTPSMRKTCEGCGEVGKKTIKGLCAECGKESRKGMRVLERRRQRGIKETMPCLTTLVKRPTLYECQVCARMYRPKRSDRKTTCSRECGTLWAGYVTAAKANGCRVSVVTRHGSCGHCGKGYTIKATEAYCSESCRALAARGKITSGHKPKLFECAECGQHVATKYGDKRSRYCSKNCMARALRRVARKRERAVLRRAKVETVDPNVVFERDGWRCRDCGVKTPRSARGTYKRNAPELDHVMPLSLGGEHSYRNTQCLCRACNAAKANTPKGQLSLL